MAKHLPSSAVLLLYKSYVRPAIEYAIPIWCFRTTKEHLAVLDVLQAKVCRSYLRSKNIKYNVHERKENLNRLCFLESLQFRRQFLCLIILFKYIHYTPQYLSQFNILITTSQRRPNKLVLASHGQRISNLFLHKICTLWNCLPPSITSIKSLSEFRKQAHKHLFLHKFKCQGIP